MFSSCVSKKKEEKLSVEDEGDALEMSGLITYPFVSEGPIAVNSKRDPFVIRSRSHGGEVEIQIPDRGEEYSVEVPVDAIPLSDSVQTSQPTLKTDRELTSSFPTVQSQNPRAALLDRAFGVGPAGEAPEAAPSYVMSLAKIKDYFAKKKFELALVEVDNALNFYPTATDLYKMKGTLLLHMSHPDLAFEAWTKAHELDPSDKRIEMALKRLRP